MGKLDHPDIQWAVQLLNYGVPDKTRTRMVLADDLMPPNADRGRLEHAAANLSDILADGSISSAELKGLLNRASAKMWGAEYDRVFKPVEFLTELKTAVNDYLRRHPELR